MKGEMSLENFIESAKTIKFTGAPSKQKSLEELPPDVIVDCFACGKSYLKKFLTTADYFNISANEIFQTLICTSCKDKLDTGEGACGCG